MTPKIESLLKTTAELLKEKLPLGATSDVIAISEKELDMVFPDQLRRWLASHNGMNLLPARYYGVCRSDKERIDARFILSEQMYPIYRALKWFPIADDGCGNYWVMPTLGDRHPILFVDNGYAEDKAKYVVASDLEHFLEMILEDQIATRRDFKLTVYDRWPGNEAFVRARDPKIGEYDGVYPMWEADRHRS